MKYETYNSKFGRNRIYEECELEDFLLDNEKKNMLEGYKTYIGITLTFLGYLGLGYIISAEQLGQLINAILQGVGIVLSVYGNYKAHQK